MADDRTDDPLTGTERLRGDAGAAVGEEDTMVIRAEIVETRERMGETLGEIGERLNPYVMKEQVTERVKESVHEATIGRIEHMADSAREKVGETTSTIGDTIRDNPVPAAMAAIGLGWLLWNGRKEGSDRQARRGPYGARPSSGRTDSYGRPYAAGYAGDASYAGSPYGSASYGASGSAGEEHEGVMDRAREGAGALADRAHDAAGTVTHRAHDAAGTVAHRAHELADDVARTTRRGAGRVEDMFFENPLALGAVTMAIGVAAGMAAPATDREVQLMGGARDRLVDRAMDMAEEATDKVKHVAERATQETEKAAREEGLTR